MSRLGELIGLACRKATQEALRWQNGLEASYTRGVFHALGRYGVKEATFFDDIAPHLDADDMELLRKNSKAALYEPLVGAAAHAAAAVLDRVRHGSLPASVQAEAIIQQAALLAAKPCRAAGALAGVSRGAPRRRVHRSEDDPAGGHRARLVAQVAFKLTSALAPAASALALAVVLDLALGDPVYRGHPVRLIGRTLQRIESALWRIGANGYGGGVLLFVALASCGWAASSVMVVRAARSRRGSPGRCMPSCSTAFWRWAICCITAGGSSGRCAAAICRRRAVPCRNWSAATPIGWMTAACRRAAVESLSENLTDGFVSPLCWYVVAGLPGVVLFKVVSTMDSMVGYKTPRYLRFGWCGARLDDLMNLVPARLTFILLSITATVLPGYSGRKALRVGLGQHSLLPGPNSGWSEAATAGALQRRLVGPIWMHGHRHRRVVGRPVRSATRNR